MIRKGSKRWHEVVDILETAYHQYAKPDFVPQDPISLPKRFTDPRDQEIIGFWVAILSWGNRKSIIQSGEKLIDLMEGEPYRFVTDHQESDRKRFESFIHRTFQPTDALYFLAFLQDYYRKHVSLEMAFLDQRGRLDLDSFYQRFFDMTYVPDRTRKHIASKASGSSCKRLNMFLRWMVRPTTEGVDLGIWTTMKPSELFVPLDVHVHRTAFSLGITTRKQTNWKTVEEITDFLQRVDPHDPIRFDYALFGLGLDGSQLL